MQCYGNSTGKNDGFYSRASGQWQSMRRLKNESADQWPNHVFHRFIAEMVTEVEVLKNTVVKPDPESPKRQNVWSELRYTKSPCHHLGAQSSKQPGHISCIHFIPSILLEVLIFIAGFEEETHFFTKIFVDDCLQRLPVQKINHLLVHHSTSISGT